MIQTGVVAARAPGVLVRCRGGGGRHAVSTGVPLVGRDSPQRDLSGRQLTRPHGVRPAAELLHLLRRGDVLVRDGLVGGGRGVGLHLPQLLVVWDGVGLGGRGSRGRSFLHGVEVECGGQRGCGY